MNASQIVEAYHAYYRRTEVIARTAAASDPYGMMAPTFRKMAAESRFIAACFATVQPQAGLGRP